MLSFLANFRGELAALSAALIWAIASFVFVSLGARMSPIILNAVKCMVGIGLTALTLWLLPNDSPNLSQQAIWILGVSGALGIGLGDTAFFGSLNILGPRRAVLMESLAPPLTAIIAGIFLQETLSLMAWAGIFLTVGGVSWVVAEREAVVNPDLQGDRLWKGVFFGLVAALCQAGGAVLSRGVLAGTDINPLWSTLIRLMAGVLVLILWATRQPHSLKELRWMRSPRFVAILASTAFASTFLGIWLQQTALKFTAAGIAQSLSATTPLFVLPIALAVGERVSLRATLGAVMALAGVWLLFAR